MAEHTTSAPFGERRVASTAGGGTALTSTASFTSFFKGTNHVTLMPRNAATAVVIRWALNPYLAVLKTTDALVAATNLTDASEAVQDNNTSTTLSMNSFDTLASGDILYVGARVPFRGVRVIIGNTNSGSNAALTVKYWKSDGTWATTSVTDGTSSASKTFAQTGNATWTLPTDWVPTSLRAAGDTVLFAPSILNDPTIYWTRWETDVVFDSTVTVTGMQSMNRSTAYDEFPVDLGYGQPIYRGLGGTGCIEHLTDAGTANLIISCGAINTTGRFTD